MLSLFHPGFLAVTWIYSCTWMPQLTSINTVHCTGVRFSSGICLAAYLAALTSADSIVVSWRFVLTYKAGLVDAGWGRRWRGAGYEQVLPWARALSLYSCRRRQWENRVLHLGRLQFKVQFHSGIHVSLQFDLSCINIEKDGDGSRLEKSWLRCMDSGKLTDKQQHHHKHSVALWLISALTRLSMFWRPTALCVINCIISYFWLTLSFQQTDTWQPA